MAGKEGLRFPVYRSTIHCSVNRTARFSPVARSHCSAPGASDGPPTTEENDKPMAPLRPDETGIPKLLVLKGTALYQAVRPITSRRFLAGERSTPFERDGRFLAKMKRRVPALKELVRGASGVRPCEDASGAAVRGPAACPRRWCRGRRRRGGGCGGWRLRSRARGVASVCSRCRRGRRLPLGLGRGRRVWTRFGGRPRGERRIHWADTQFSVSWSALPEPLFRAGVPAWVWREHRSIVRCIWVQHFIRRERVGAP